MQRVYKIYVFYSITFQIIRAWIVALVAVDKQLVFPFFFFFFFFMRVAEQLRALIDQFSIY